MPDSLSVTRMRTRQHPRYEVSIPVDCSTRHVFVSNCVSNISKGGLLFRMPPPATLPGTLTLTITLPDQRKLKFPSEVRHVSRLADVACVRPTGPLVRR